MRRLIPAKTVFRSFEVSASPVCDQLRSEREVGQGALSSTLSRRSALVLCQRGNVGLFGSLQGADQGFLLHGWLLSSFELARFRAIPSQEACQTRIDSTAVLDPLKNNSLTQKIQRILNVWANDYPNGYLTTLIDTRQVVD